MRQLPDDPGPSRLTTLLNLPDDPPAVGPRRLNGWIPQGDRSMPEAPEGPGRHRLAVPSSLRGSRWAPSANAVWSILIAVAVLALVLGARVAAAAGRSTPAPVAPATTPAQVSLSVAPSTTPPPLVVHVTGHVERPGVLTLPVGSRVVDAIAAAGGASDDADLARLNLAALLTDGIQVYVPAPGENPPTLSAAPQGSGELLDLNSADATALDQLPGVGPVLAGRIVAWRADHGPFRTVDQLGEVSGIGDAVLSAVRDLVVVR